MFILSNVIALFYFIGATFISINWINDLTSIFGIFFAIYLVTFVALVPGFNYMFVITSLFFNKRKKKELKVKEKDVTILIPMYNSEKVIKETMEAIKKQKYNGRIYVKIIDDGSKDNSLRELEKLNLDYKIKILEQKHSGKAHCLNNALKEVDTEYVITVDDDTVLHPLAVKNIVKKMENSSDKTVAVAGCLFVKNGKKSLITRLQEYDYSLGIFGIKLVQGGYNSTLVTQGAFSIYKTKILKEIKGWNECVGEDIVLTWKLLSLGYETNFAPDAVGFTKVPETLEDLAKQRKRWARGMIEAFKRVKVMHSENINLKAKLLMCEDIFFPFIDFAILVFIPLGLIELFLGKPILISVMTILVIPFGMLQDLVVEIKRRNIMKKLNLKIEKRSALAFLFYTFIYSFLLAPFCLSGYFSEILNTEKKW